MTPGKEHILRWQEWVKTTQLWASGRWMCLGLRIDGTPFNLLSKIVLGDDSSAGDGYVLNDDHFFLFSERLAIERVCALSGAFSAGMIASRVLGKELAMNVQDQIAPRSPPRMIPPDALYDPIVDRQSRWPRYVLNLASGSVSNYLGARFSDFEAKLQRTISLGFGDISDIAQDNDLVDGPATPSGILSGPTEFSLVAPVRATIGSVRWSSETATLFCPYVNELNEPERRRIRYTFKGRPGQVSVDETPPEVKGILSLGNEIPLRSSSLWLLLDDQLLQSRQSPARNSDNWNPGGGYAYSRLAQSVPPPEFCEAIGRGGFGEVFKYVDSSTKCSFALKILSPYPFNQGHGAKERFLREAFVLLRLNHKAIVRVYDYGELADGRLYINMQFVAGHNLTKMSTPGQHITRSIALDVASALAHAHAKGITHRDLKESNVMFDPDTRQTIVLDFGLAGIVDPDLTSQRLTRTETFGGSFCAPELVANPHADGRPADVYSLGALVFRLIVGRAPSGEATTRLLREEATDRGFSSDEIELLSRMLHNDPALRPPAIEVEQLLCRVSDASDLTGHGTVAGAGGQQADVASDHRPWHRPK